MKVLTSEVRPKKKKSKLKAYRSEGKKSNVLFTCEMIMCIENPKKSKRRTNRINNKV